MKIIVFGAGGRTGKLTLEQLLQAGYDVTAFVRNAAQIELVNENLTIIEGDALTLQSVIEAIKGQDVVVSCLGGKGMGKATYLATMGENIAQAMKANGISRIVYLASAGVDQEIPGIMGKMIMKMLGNVLKDHKIAIDALKAANLNWTIGRPMSLTDGPLTGTYREEFTSVPSGGRGISRADVAHFIVKAVGDDSYIKKSVGLSY